jgi:hypothetical protein
MMFVLCLFTRTQILFSNHLKIDIANIGTLYCIEPLIT